MDKLSTFINELKNYNNYKKEIIYNDIKIKNIINALNEKIKYMRYLEAGVTGVDPFKEHSISQNQEFLAELRLEKIEKIYDLIDLYNALIDYAFKNIEPKIIKDEWLYIFDKIIKLKKDKEYKKYIIKKIDDRLSKMDELTNNIFIEKYINNKPFDKLSKEINLSIGGIQKKMKSEFNKES